MRTRQIDVAWEIDAIVQALAGARCLIEAFAQDGLENEEDRSRTSIYVTAWLGLLGCRLAQVRRVLSGSADPGSLLAPHNESIGVEDPHEPSSLKLSEWTKEERRAHAERVVALVGGSKPRRQRTVRP